jgi:hypothetical protein
VISLSSARIVATIAPRQWFGGLDRRTSFALLENLQTRFGTTFYQFDSTPFTAGDTQKQQQAIADLRAFKPHLAISLANASYGLTCAVKRSNGSANVFTDILKIPLMMLWDHGLFGFPALILAPLPDRPEDSRPDALAQVAKVIDSPLMYHQPIDSGQVREMRRLGMLNSENVRTDPAVAYKPFLDFGARPRANDYVDDVAFVGNVQLSGQYELGTDQSVAGRCRAAIVAAKLANPSVPAWTLLNREVAALSPADRTENSLDYDQSYFWHFAENVIGVHCNTQSRMQVLESLKRKVAFYGAFLDPAGLPRLRETEHIEYKGYVDFSEGLPQVYAHTRIVVDMTQAAFIDNCSTKPICCFASGGFSLFDYRPDPIAHLGQDIERVMFRTLDDLNAKIDYFLSHEREREDLADHLKDLIQRKCNFVERVYESAAKILSERAGSGAWTTLRDIGFKIFYSLPFCGLPPPLQVVEEPDTPGGPTRRLATVPTIPQIDPSWVGAKLRSDSPTEIETAQSPWGYSALFSIGGQRRRRDKDRLWVEVTVRMIKGRAGIGLMLRDYALIDERVISTENGVSKLFFPVPTVPILGLLVRSTDVPSSVIEVADLALVAELDLPAAASNGSRTL